MTNPRTNTQIKALIGLSIAGLIGGGIYAAVSGSAPTIDQETKYTVAMEFAATAELTLQLEHSYTQQQQDLLAQIKRHMGLKQAAWDKAQSQCGAGYVVQFADAGPACIKLEPQKGQKK